MEPAFLMKFKPRGVVEVHFGLKLICWQRQPGDGVSEHPFLGWMRAEPLSSVYYFVYIILFIQLKSFAK
jgi:hypothetical protein